MNVYLTGSTGYGGSALLGELERAAHRVARLTCPHRDLRRPETYRDDALPRTPSCTPVQR